MNTTTISLQQKKNPSLNVTNITDDFAVVKAPSDMEEGFMFASQNNGIKFNVTVPKGGVRKGQEWAVRMNPDEYNVNYGSVEVVEDEEEKPGCFARISNCCANCYPGAKTRLSLGLFFLIVAMFVGVHYFFAFIEEYVHEASTPNSAFFDDIVFGFLVLITLLYYISNYDEDEGSVSDQTRPSETKSLIV
mmetsp:Transcript_49770/g.50151  ORF Transcript_49770/g.50151 Transcript_49770/m.50151 type:complete len:190 (-) Transcript_49770:239-808(-)|eukprot:CAMPEP_0171326384 /NCGR_PEP_ID=MMETSP0816-20121228/117420_1 /TAXON_ID=420281 /ORGANISM="Proboscia inermis, Strain CCAP1064/1" /LENGTH=189 /DNA_ID=CAMNT_0011825839 /DNA_START=482 /DNA_END=1051 /DNA_ORIENTATION=+